MLYFLYMVISLLAHLLPVWLELFAVATPGGIHHHKVVTPADVSSEAPVCQHIQLALLTKLFCLMRLTNVTMQDIRRGRLLSW